MKDGINLGELDNASLSWSLQLLFIIIKIVVNVYLLLLMSNEISSLKCVFHQIGTTKYRH